MRSLFIVLLLLGIIFFGAYEKLKPNNLVVGVLSHASVADASFTGFKEGLEKLGYKEGVDINYVYEGATETIAALPEAMQRLLTHKPDLILTLTTPAALEAQRATKTSLIPIVFAPASDPVGSGLVKSIQKPSTNLTGVTFGLQEIKRLEWFLKLLPEAKNIYYPYNGSDKSPVLALKRLEAFMQTQPARFVTADVKSVEAIKHSLQNLPKEIDAIFLPTDALVSSKDTWYIKTALEKKLPLTVPHRGAVKKGAFMSYGFGVYDLGFQASRLAHEIFQGRNPADIPVENSEFKLSFNLGTAEILGVEINNYLLNQAILYK